MIDINNLRLQKSLAWAVPLFFLVLNFILKCYYIGETSLWGDEAHSIYTALMPLNELIDVAKGDQNPPLYNILLSWYVHFFGISPLAVRSLSAIFSSLTVLVIFRYCYLKFDIHSAIIVSTLFTFSNTIIYYSQETRAFALIGLLASLSIFVFQKLIDNPKIKYAIILGILNACLIYAHFISVFWLISQAFVILIWYLKDNKIVFNYFISGCITVLLFSPWLSFLMNNLPKSGNFWLKAPNEFKEIFSIFDSFINNSFILHYLFGLFVFLVGLALYFRFFKKTKLNLSLPLQWCIYSFLPIVMCFLVAKYVTPIFLPRYILYSLIALYMLYTVLISSLISNVYLRYLLILPIIFMSIKKINLKPGKGEDWKKAVSEIKNHQSQDNYIIISPWYQYKTFCYYYNIDDFKDYNHTLDRLKAKNISFTDYPDVLNEFKNKRNIVYVTAYGGDEYTNNVALKQLKEKYKLMNIIDVNQIKIHYFTIDTNITKE